MRDFTPEEGEAMKYEDIKQRLRHENDEVETIGIILICIMTYGTVIFGALLKIYYLWR